MMTGLGRRMARERAAIALGHFDNEDSRRALTDCLNNQSIASACHLGLFRQSGDLRHLRAVADHLEQKSFAGTSYIIDALDSMESADAKKLARKYKD